MTARQTLANVVVPTGLLPDTGAANRGVSPSNASSLLLSDSAAPTADYFSFCTKKLLHREYQIDKIRRIAKTFPRAKRLCAILPRRLEKVAAGKTLAASGGGLDARSVSAGK